MERGLDDVATVVADVSRAAASALDPASVLERTFAVLARLLPIAAVELWRDGPDGLHHVATHPARPDSPPPLPPGDPHGPDEAGRHQVSVTSRGQVLGRLVVTVAPDAQLDGSDLALVEITARLVGGAIERLDLYTEVMELERLKSDFIARVSHELRTPITIISGFLETLIAHDGDLDAERRLHMLDRSRVAASRLGHLIEELLILSRLEGGVLTPRPSELDAAAAFEAVRSTSAEPEHVLVAELAGGPVRTDGQLLVQALGLVVDNAIKYGGAAELSTHRDGDRWVVVVRDRGPGFADDVRDTAFEMFTRSPTVAAVPGLGVGLALARTIVEVLDGRIAVADANPGPGAEVRISLPA